jgi:hypothetical protein
MNVLAGLVALAIVISIARLLVRLLGPPWTSTGLTRWVAAMVVVALIYSGRAELSQLFSHVPGAWGKSGEERDIIILVTMLALALYGRRAWRESEDRSQVEGERAQRAREHARRRALPAPPRLRTPPDGQQAPGEEP